MRKQFFSLICILFAFCFLSNVKSAYATSFTIIAPSGTLSRGQDVPFTVSINTEESTVTSIQTGMNYDTSYLEYVSAVPGTAMNTITVDTSVGAGKLLLTGTNNTGFKGTDVYATVTFKIIADSPGSTEVCTLWTPTAITPSPTTPPTAQSCNSSCTTSSQCPSDLTCYIAAGQTTGVCRRTTCTDRVDCVCPQPTSPPVETALPVTGGGDSKNVGTLAGIAFILVAGSILFLSKKNKVYHHSESKSSHKKEVKF